jgi:phosphoribosylanthranilate isomerase
VFVKVDGVTCLEDALACVAVGVDAVGFVFAPSSRQVAVSLVADIVGSLPSSVLTLGVFVDEAPGRVVETVQRCGLGGAQLHGVESASDARWIRSQVGTVLKAFGAGSSVLGDATSYGADAVIVDSPGGGGGSGRSYDWSLAADVPLGMRVILAGGLTPGNVGAAIAAVHPWGVDVSSGVESSPGRKDPALLAAFVSAARSAA